MKLLGKHRRYVAMTTLIGLASGATFFSLSSDDSTILRSLLGRQNPQPSTRFAGKLIAKDNLTENIASFTFSAHCSTCSACKQLQKDQQTTCMNLKSIQDLCQLTGLVGLWHLHAIDAGNIYRAYTPLSPLFFDDSKRGKEMVEANERLSISFLIKKVGVQGYLSNFIHSLRLQDWIELFGSNQVLEFDVQRQHPLMTEKEVIEASPVSWKLRNTFNEQSWNQVRNVVLISTGTGIAPMIQLLTQFYEIYKQSAEVFSESGSSAKRLPKLSLKMFHFVRREKDIILVENFNRLIEGFAELKESVDVSLEVTFVLRDLPTTKPAQSLYIQKRYHSFEKGKQHASKVALKGCTIIQGAITKPTIEKLLRVETGGIHSQADEASLSNSKRETAVMVCGSNSFLSKLCGAGHEDGYLFAQPALAGILHSLEFVNDQVFRL